MKILVIGELCIDKFVYGKVSRLCPEAPVPVFNPLTYVENPGMAGNVVENVKAIRPNYEIEFWHQEKTIIKQRIVDEKSNQMIVRIDEGDHERVDPFNQSGLSSDMIKKFDLIIISDYDKGYLSENDLKKISSTAKSFSKICVVDTKKKISSTSTLRDFSFIKMNEDDSLNNKHLSELPNLITTLGKKGARVGGVLYKQKYPKETIDVSGAGDTFIAAFSVKYMETLDVEKSVHYANELSGIVVGKRGVAIPS